MSDQSSYDALVRSYSDATYESARLRMFSDLARVATEQAKEIERLRENVEEAARLNLAVMKESEHFFKEAERLRELLEDAFRWHDQFPIQRVREALNRD